MKTIRPVDTFNWDAFAAALAGKVEGFTVADYAARKAISFTNAYGKLETARAQGKLVREKDGAVFKYRAVKEKR